MNRGLTPDIAKAGFLGIFGGKKTGKYEDTAANRRLGRVGKKYSKEPKKSRSEREDKRKEDIFEPQKKRLLEDVENIKNIPTSEITGLRNHSLHLLRRYLQNPSLSGGHEVMLAVAKIEKESNRRTINKGIIMRTGLTQENLEKSFSEFDLEKGRAMPEGTIRTFGKRKFIKQGGQWRSYSEGGRTPADEGIAAAKQDVADHKMNVRMDAILGKISDNPKSWKDADDTARDLARHVRETYNELVLDLVEGDKGEVKALNFRSFDTPKEWNKQAKKQVKNLWGKMDSWAKKQTLKHWHRGE